MPEPDRGAALFPSTLWSEVLALQKDDVQGRRERLEKLIGRYWRPVYWALRREGNLNDEESRDLTQDFFIQILEGGVLPGVDPHRGSFRGYLRGALRNFLMNEWRKGAALKRGAGRKPLPIDFAAAGSEPPALGADAETALDRAWGRQILDEALRDLEAVLAREGRPRDMEVFRIYDLDPGPEKPSYDEVARRMGFPKAEVWTALRYCRRKMRDLVLEKISPYVQNEQQLFEELHDLFGG